MSEHDQALVRSLLTWLRFEAPDTVLVNTSTGCRGDPEDIEALAVLYQHVREVSHE